VGLHVWIAARDRDKPRLPLENNTAGVREREDENRTREAGNRDEVEGGVANMLDSFPNEASLLAKAFGVGFIDWLDFTEIESNRRPRALGRAIPRRRVCIFGILPTVGCAGYGKHEAPRDSQRRSNKSCLSGW
jgi:hypothetical protein